MSTVAKILVVLNLALAAIFLGSAANYLGQIDSYRDQLTAEQKSHKDTITVKEQRESDLMGQIQRLGEDLRKARAEGDLARAEADRLQGQLTWTTEAYNQTQENANRLVRSVDQLTNSLNAARDMIAALQTDLENARKGLVEARTDRDAKLAQVNRLQIQLNSETEARKALEGRLAEAQERMSSLEFENAWFKRRFPGAVASDQPAHTGQILAVEGDRNVVVISLGEEDGVRPGYQYLVSRGGDYVATIQITDVQAKQSAGRALSDISKGEIRRGDRVMSSQ